MSARRDPIYLAPAYRVLTHLVIAAYAAIEALGYFHINTATTGAELRAALVLSIVAVLVGIAALLFTLAPARAAEASPVPIAHLPAVRAAWYLGIAAIALTRIAVAFHANTASIGADAARSYGQILLSIAVLLLAATDLYAWRQAHPRAAPLAPPRPAGGGTPGHPGIGGRLGKYEIRATLGRGASGTVYRAWDPVIAREVAIKTVPLPDPGNPGAADLHARFRREAQAAGALQHPNVVGIFDYGETPDLAYIVMEFIDGPTLKALIDGTGRLGLAGSRRLMDDLLAGLEYCHARGVVHRDIKPANIMVTREGRAKIADFGIARTSTGGMTQTGTILGTPAYMSPEQFVGENIDARTDLYSAGVILYQLLSGTHPFEGSESAIMHKVLTVPPPPLPPDAAAAPTALNPVIARALAKRPEDRYANAAAFAAALDRAITVAHDATIIATRAGSGPVRKA